MAITATLLDNKKMPVFGQTGSLSGTRCSQCLHAIPAIELAAVRRLGDETLFLGLEIKHLHNHGYWRYKSWFITLEILSSIVIIFKIPYGSSRTF